MNKCKNWEGTWEKGICYNNKKENMARKIYQETNNVVLISGQKVGRICKNTHCVEPTHLVAYTGVMLYTTPEYPSRQGANNYHHTLTAAEVRRMRAKRKKGAKMIALAAEFNISKAQVCRICQNKAWSHI